MTAALFLMKDSLMQGPLSRQQTQSQPQINTVYQMNSSQTRAVPQEVWLGQQQWWKGEGQKWQIGMLASASAP